ncbi:TPA: DUF4865 family protein [Clostridioides difficile]|nr:DUF4865 family protein [Clostridioides difficile]
MIAMQYKVLLTNDFDMSVIKKRVSINGSKTDGFQDLLFKAYLISKKKDNEESNNEYSPLYLWKDSTGMNKFIFDGFYDNILNSFGWQNINIGIPMICELEKDFNQSQYVIEVENKIQPVKQMKSLKFSRNYSNCIGKVLIYNPDKWKYVEYYFFSELPVENIQGQLYQVLHLSM